MYHLIRKPLIDKYYTARELKGKQIINKAKTEIAKRASNFLVFTFLLLFETLKNGTIKLREPKKTSLS